METGSEGQSRQSRLRRSVIVYKDSALVDTAETVTADVQGHHEPNPGVPLPVSDKDLDDSSDNEELKAVDHVQHWLDNCNEEDGSIIEDDLPPTPSDDLKAPPDEVIDRGVAVSHKFAEQTALKVPEYSFKRRRLNIDELTNISKVVSLEGDEKFHCSVCDRSFSHRSNVRYHVACSGAAVGYSCSHCDRTFKSSSHLTYHIRSQHSHERPYKCNYCEQSFTQMVKLKRHKLSHTGERPFSCDKCDKKFKANYQLKEHQNIHEEVPRYSCSVCDKQFSDRNNLRRHKNTVHKEAEYKCKECGLVSKSKFDHESHRAEHLSPENTCAHCGKCFKQRKDVLRHQRTHDKSITCKLCPKVFSRKDHLKKHVERSHSLKTNNNIEDEDDEVGLVVDEEAVDDPENIEPEHNKNDDILGSINDLPSAIYDNSKIDEIFEVFTSSKLNEVLLNMEPSKVSTLTSILSVHQKTDPANGKVKKRLLTRYRNQSGVGPDPDHSDHDGGDHVPRMSLSVEQKRAAAQALAKLMREHRESLLDSPRRSELESACSTPQPQQQQQRPVCSEKTVIRMTPYGPRKLTIYDDGEEHAE